MDAVAGLRPCAVDVLIRGETYTIPALPAADWLAAIVGDAGSIVPGLLDDEDRDQLTLRVMRGQVEPDDLNRAWRDALGAAAGRSWWSASRLCQSATDEEAWPIVHGRLFADGVDLERVSIGALCNALFFMIMSGAEDDSKRAQARFELELPPPGAEAELHEDRASVAEDFMAAMAQFQALS